MISNNIKNLVFDFGGVLVQLNLNRCISAFSALGFNDVEKHVGACSKDGFFQDFELGNISQQEFCDKIANLCSKPVTNEQIISAWNSFLDGVPDYLMNALIELRKHYRVILLSNTNEPHWIYSCREYFSHDGYSVDDHFEKIFLSYKMHKTKPDTAIFEQMCSEADLIPEETLFLDDSKANCMAAESLGINARHITPGEDWRVLFDMNN